MTSLLSRSVSRSLSCRYCGSESAVDFGPYGFLATCKICGRDEHLDDMMDPVWSGQGMGGFSVRQRVSLTVADA